MPFDLITGRFIPEKTNIWRDCVDGYLDWVKVGLPAVSAEPCFNLHTLC